MKKRITAMMLTIFILCTLFTACGEVKENNADKLNIVCTVFPYYDWVRNITEGAENVNVTLLLDSGTDLHSYQPTAADIVTITSSDIFIYTGGESDKWVDDVLKTSSDSSVTVIDLIESLPETELYCVEAIGEEEEHEHEEGEEHNHTYDEHIWLSIKNSIKYAEIIKNALTEKNGENKEIYEANCKRYIEKLDELNKSYEAKISSAAKDTVIFADRFPFIYLMKDYNINYYAAFSGCSAESEASFETVTALAQKTDELGLSYILISETSDGSVANTVKNSTMSKDQQILTLNALQSVTKDKLSCSYIEVMSDNLDILITALS